MYNYDSYLIDLKNKLQYSHIIARQNLFEAKSRSKRYFDENTMERIFNVGDSVVLKDRANFLGKGLGHKWSGPYTIMSVPSSIHSEILCGNKIKRVHNNHLKPWFGRNENNDN